LLQEKMLAILLEAVRSSELLLPDDILAGVHVTKLSTPKEASEIVRMDRGGR